LTKVDPASGTPVDAATPLVRSKAAELGLRTEALPNVQSSLALWYLKLDSELVFVGDAGSTEAGRSSQRYGVEWSARWRPKPWMFVDLDVAFNHARFTGSAPEGDYIPGAPDAVVSAGIAVDRYGPWSGAVFLRYIGSYPLSEDNSVRSNAQNNDITYFYESRLPGEPSAGVADVHFHPGQPRSFRVSLSYRF
jgi:hypothetical protein